MNSDLVFVAIARMLRGRGEWERCQICSRASVAAAACLCTKQPQLTIRGGEGITEGLPASIEPSRVYSGGSGVRNDYPVMNKSQGSPTVLDIRLGRYRRVLYFVAYKLLRNHQEAREAVRNCLLSASCDMPWFECEGALRSWLVRILIDEALLILFDRRTQSAPR